MNKKILISAIVAGALAMCSCGNTDPNTEKTQADTDTSVTAQTETDTTDTQEVTATDTTDTQGVTATDTPVVDDKLLYVFGSDIQCRFDVNFLSSELSHTDEVSGVEIWHYYYDITSTDTGYDLKGTLRIPRKVPSDVISGLLDNTVDEFDAFGMNFTLTDSECNDMGRYTYYFAGSDGNHYHISYVLDPMSDYYLGDEEGMWYYTFEDYILSVPSGSPIQSELNMMMEASNNPFTVDFAVTFAGDGTISDIRAASESAVLKGMEDLQ